MPAELEIRVHRIAYSTNVERVALAAAHKAVAVSWVDVDPVDRGEVIALSGQELVPVMQTPQGEVVADSMAILAWLEQHVPQPALWPLEPAARAQAALAIDWFNEVWKVAPNAIDDELGKKRPREQRIAGWSRQLGGWLRRFEDLLQGHDFLLGDELGVLDVCAFPFLKYGVITPAAGDDERFHHVLHDYQGEAAALPALMRWIARVDALPRA